nr:CDP-glycerol glycerophosphotransferase family protein [Bacteroidaceae bacterium]
DAMYMGIPIFLYVPDLKAYEVERGRLLWNLEDLPFPYALSEEMLYREICDFDDNVYLDKINKFTQMLGLKQPGDSSRLVVDFIESKLRSS